ncbi:MAG: DUF953 domain-containing protein, partial [archaeon]|nr:DUF953 domain-containing protein [archaeon]
MEKNLSTDELNNEFNTLIKEKKNFFFYFYGAHTVNGGSWCPDCVKAEPFVKKAKEEILSKNNSKEILFYNIPIERSIWGEYKKNNVAKCNKVPMLIYYNKG